MINNYQIEASNKFKTNYVQVRYLIDANKENTTKASLLAMYLIYANNTHQDYKSASDNLDSLYGSKVDINIGLSGEHLVFNFILSFVATKYVKDETYLNSIISSFLDYIFNPLQEDGVFDLEFFELKKYELHERIKMAYDDKTTYAIEQFLEVFATGYPLSLNTNGYSEDLEKLSVEDISSFYNALIKQEALVSGNVSSVDQKMITRYLQAKIPSTTYSKKYHWYNLSKVEKQSKIENQDLVQSKLVVGYAFNETLAFEDYYTGLVLNSLFGMSSNSYLFNIVREQENLCYSIRSNLDLYSNSILIYAGIEKENSDKTASLIDQILLKISNNDISDDEFNDAKTVMLDVINKINDSQGGLVNYYANRALQGFKASLKDDLEYINKVSKKQVVDLVKKLEHKTTYLLSGDKHE